MGAGCNMPENKTAMKKGKRGLLWIIFSRTMLITLLLLLNFLYLFSLYLTDKGIYLFLIDGIYLDFICDRINR